MQQETNYITEKQTFELQGRTFQEHLCKIILDDSTFAGVISEVLDLNFLDVKYLRVFTSKIFEYRKKYTTHPTRETIAIIVRSELEKEDDLIKKQVREYLARIESGTFSSEGEQHIKDVALDFCKKQKLKEALIKSVDLIKSSSFDEVSKVINDAIKLGTDNNIGYDFVVDFEKRYQLIVRNAISTGWKKIDDITKGGLGRGELGVVLAGTGLGKSLILCHLGAKALEQGKNVVYYTLELRDTVVATRFDSCLTNIPMNDLPNMKEKVLESIRDVTGKLIVKEYPTKSASIVTLRNHLDKLKRSGFNPDLVIVDYADLMRFTSGGFKSDEKRHALEGVYEELRGIAQQYQVALYTCSQVNRQNSQADVVTLEGISEAYSKCFVADFIISLARTIKDKENKEGRIFVAKNRNGPDGIVFPIYMDAGSVKIDVLDQSHETVSEIQANSAKDQLEQLRTRYKDFKKEKN